MNTQTLKCLVTSFLTVFLAVPVCEAQFVNVQQAQERVMAFDNGRKPAGARGQSEDRVSVSLVHTEWDKTHDCPSVYVFNRPENGGFVIVSADERAAPILGYTDTGNWNAEDMPEALRSLLADYGKGVCAAREQPLSAVRRAANYSENWEVIAPLIKTQWGQHEPYNNLCPVKNGRRCLTGCVATAFAQIMYYHRWPNHGEGSYGYTTNGVEVFADFGATRYQWDKMRLKYNRNDYDEGNAVATLMYHCGVAHNMEYSANESYGYFNWGWDNGRSCNEMAKFFRYDSEVWGMYKDNVSELEFASTIYNNLRQKLPVIYNATPTNGESPHVYICDGYDGGGFFHINWGWDGSGDGFFLLTDMDGYDLDRIILYDIMPQLMKGDINDNERIDIGDVVMAQSFLLEEQTPTERQLKVADMNGNGRIDVGDVVVIMNSVLMTD